MLLLLFLLSTLLGKAGSLSLLTNNKYYDSLDIPLSPDLWDCSSPQEMSELICTPGYLPFCCSKSATECFQPPIGPHYNECNSTWFFYFGANVLDGPPVSVEIKPHIDQRKYKVKGIVIGHFLAQLGSQPLNFSINGIYYSDFSQPLVIGNLTSLPTINVTVGPSSPFSTSDLSFWDVRLQVSSSLVVPLA